MEGVAIENVKIRVLPDGRVDTKNASAFVGLSEKTMAIMRCHGKGPKYVKRGRIFYFIEDLQAWVKDGEAKSTSQSRVK